MVRTKGIFDLLEIAKGFTSSGRLDIEFDLCGDGSELEKLRQSTIEAGLQNRFRCHGHCTREKMREMYQRCHVVIVPTTSEIGEGFNKVVVEGVLAGRPVITSEACPAVEYVKQAAVIASPNTPAAYASAILLLKDDPTLYAAKRSNCQAVSAPFFDPTQSWKSALANAVQPL
jgi:glycosyltransferase involved in cell wall biosynthesis